MATIITAAQGFDETYYLEAKAAQLTSSTGTTWTVAQTLAAITAAGLTPAEHYSLYGYNEGLSPNGYFNSAEYAASKAAAAGISASDFEIAWYNASGSTNLYLHYLQYGAFEDNVNPSAGFNDLSYYTAKAAEMGPGSTWEDARDAIKAAGMTAISHYLLYGVNESLSYTPTSGGTTGQTYRLTTGIDTFTGTSGNDTFDGSLTGGAQTFQSFDTLNGGGGVDKLVAVLTANTTTTTTTLQNIENVQLYTPAAGITLDLTATTGVNEIGVTAPAGNAMVSGLSSTVTTLDVTSTANAAANTFTFQYQNSALSGSADAVTLNLNNVGDTTAADTINIQPASGAEGVETINVVSGGAQTNRLTLTGGTASTDTSTINVTGSAGLTANLAAFTKLTTFDGSAATGALNATFANGTTGLAATGGSGNDTFTFAAGSITSANTLDGGAGTNTLVINDTTITAAEYTALAAATNFTTLGFATASVAYDASKTAFKSFAVLNGGGANAISKLATGSTVAFGTTGATTTLTGDTGVTDVTLAIGSANSAGLNETLTITGLTSVTMSSNGTAANTVAITNSDNTVYTISGSDALTMTVAGNAATGDVINASAMTGAFNVTGSAFNDVITGGSGADTIVGGAGADTMTGNGGIDTYGTANNFGTAGTSVVASATNISAGGLTAGNTFTFATGTAGAVDVVTDFASTDQLDVVNGSTAPTTLIGVTATTVLTNNTTYLVYGSYDSATGVFTAAASYSATDNDALLVTGNGALTEANATGYTVLTDLSTALTTSNFI